MTVTEKLLPGNDSSDAAIISCIYDGGPRGRKTIRISSRYGYLVLNEDDAVALAQFIMES